MPDASAPLPPGCFAFGVFGDGPYRAWEEGRFRRVIQDVDRSDIAWLLHVGDIFWYPCSDEHYDKLHATLNAIQHPVIYTPGDNEWADCHEGIEGDYPPLDRLAQLRRTFYPAPTRSLGARPMRVVSQSENPAFAEFVENARWVKGGFVCATLHMVGSGNGSETFPGRSALDDSSLARRVAAAQAWLGEAFAIARRDSLHGVIIAMHSDPGLGARVPWPGYGDIAQRVKEFALHFDGEVVLIHGDAHTYVVDHPIWDPPHPKPIQNFTRIGTFGSPDIGWVRVVVDSLAGRVVAVEPRRMSRWFLW